MKEPNQHLHFTSRRAEREARRSHETKMKKRCAWCGNDSLYVSYHDNEWGVPVHDDRCLFEFLVLEGAQAGLSWLTILRKRENYRKAFDDFDVGRIAGYGRQDITRLLQDPGIVRNRLKIEAAIRNARGVLSIQEEYGALDTFLWRYFDGTPVQNTWKGMSDVPAKTKESDEMSKDLRKRGFNFVGSTICYAFMQAVGMVNDHVTDCFRYKEIAGNNPTTCDRTVPSRRRYALTLPTADEPNK